LLADPRLQEHCRGGLADLTLNLVGGILLFGEVLGQHI
jgi:hypothetical protein